MKSQCLGHMKEKRSQKPRDSCNNIQYNDSAIIIITKFYYEKIQTCTNLEANNINSPVSIIITTRIYDFFAYLPSLFFFFSA